jgi:predicted ATP-dependent protease
MTGVPARHSLAPAQLRRRCDPAGFEFDTTASLPEPQLPFGQARAVEAIRLALDMHGHGYHVFVLGEPGSSRHAMVRRLLQAHVAGRPAPVDWCYVYNFSEPSQPRAIGLPAGLGVQLRTAMDRFADELGQAVTAALESADYRARIDGIEKENKQREEHALEVLGDAARAQGVALLRTSEGIAFSPLKDGQPFKAEDFDALPEDERKRIADVIQGLRERLDGVMHQLPRQRREMQTREREATRAAMGLAAGHLIDELKARFAAEPALLGYFDEVLADVIESGSELQEQRADAGEDNGSEDDEDGSLESLSGTLSIGRYRVNLLVPHAADGHAPVVELDHPTYANLIGRVDHIAHMGTLLTNFSLVQPGALHRANGGCLMLDADKVLAQPYAWEGLKRALRAGEIRIESAPELLGWVGTLPLEPQPIPLAVKVVLIGEREHHELLQALDPEFDGLFKVAADFEDQVPRDAAGMARFAELVGALARQAGARALDRGAVAALVEHASRRAGDAGQLSTQTRPLDNLVRESDREAARAGHAVIIRADVEQAHAAWVRRSDRQRDEMLDALQRGMLLITTAGERVGEVNGLAVSESGGFRFGQPVRISATTRVGEGHVIDIERESTLGQPIHSKGVLILASYLGSRYAQGQPLSLDASLVFEQSYGPVEGDSASLAELCALLSSLAAVPIRQSMAVTGSVNQHGEVQAVGAVEEKIEGFFDACNLQGLDGHQGVVIPAAHAGRLMLREDVVEAVAQGRFQVHAVAHVDEAIELLTGVTAGAADSRGRLPEGSINRLVAARLAHMSEVRQAFGGTTPAPEPVQVRRLPAAMGMRAAARRRRAP